MPRKKATLTRATPPSEIGPAAKQAEKLTPAAKSAEPLTPSEHVPAPRSAVDAVLRHLLHLADNPAEVTRSARLWLSRAMHAAVRHDATAEGDTDVVNVHEADWTALADDVRDGETFNATAVCQAVEHMIGLQKKRHR